MNWFGHFPIISTSLSKPHIDCDNSPCAQNNGIYLSIYLCVYHLSHICRTLIPEICVCPEMLHAFRYIDVLMCMIYNCMHSTEQQARLELLILIINEDR